MTRKTFLSTLSAVPFLGLIASKTKASEPSVKLVLPTVRETPKIDQEALLWAISQVETGGNDRKVGACGSRSKYQISEKVWKQHVVREAGQVAEKTWHNFSGRMGSRYSSCKGSFAEEIARRHIYWIHRHIPRETLTEQFEREYALAYAWNAGLEGWLNVRRGIHVRSAHDYAKRVQALYQDRINSKVSA